MSLTAAAGGFVVFLLSMPGNVYLHLPCRTVSLNWDLENVQNIIKINLKMTIFQVCVFT